MKTNADKKNEASKATKQLAGKTFNYSQTDFKSTKKFVFSWRDLLMNFVDF